MKRARSRYLDSLSDLLLIGGLFGLIEFSLLLLAPSLTVDSAPQLLLVVVGFACIASVVVGVPMLLCASALLQAKWLGAWICGLRRGGAERVEQLLHLCLGLGYVFTLGIGVLKIARWARTTVYKQQNAIYLEVIGIVLFALVLAFVFLAIRQILAPHVRRAHLLQEWTSGRAGRTIVALLCILIIMLSAVLPPRLAPSFDFRTMWFVVAFASCLLLARSLGLSVRMPKRSTTIITIVFSALALASVIGISDWTGARQVASVRGTISGYVFRALWQLADGDGDGIPSTFGGQDCDDENASVHPGARELVGNGIDDNCFAGDPSDAASLAKAPQTLATATHSIVLITIDSLRADHLGAYGYDRGTTPTLDALAGESTIFEWATTPAPTTRRAVLAFMTGLYASSLDLREDSKHWPPQLKTGHHRLLAKRLSQAGYTTHGVSSIGFLKKTGVATGFDIFDASGAYTAETVATRAVSFLTSRANDKPFFLWLHFLDPHHPYKAHPKEHDFGDSDIDRYDAEIAHVDAQLARILEALRTSGTQENTIVAITSDHGEEFGEHGLRFHSRRLYNESIRVPLMIHYLGTRSRIQTPVSLVDLAPTLLELVGVAGGDTNGHSLAASVRTGQEPTPHVILSEVIPDLKVRENTKAAFYGPWKILWNLDSGTYELYSLLDDAREDHNLAYQEPELLLEMKKRLHETIEIVSSNSRQEN